MNHVRQDHTKAAMVQAAVSLQHKMGTVYIINVLSLQGIPLPVIERIVEGGPIRQLESNYFDWGSKKSSTWLHVVKR